MHVHRWGDGAEHFHLWFYVRPVGSMDLLGFGMPLWEPILPPISEAEWRANQVTVACALAKDGGRAIVGSALRLVAELLLLDLAHRVAGDLVDDLELLGHLLLGQAELAAVLGDLDERERRRRRRPA